MTITKNIIVFGCSLTYGHYCSDRQNITYGLPPSEFCWSSLLQKDRSDFKVYNYSSPGAGNISTFGNLFKRKQPHGAETLNLNEDPIDLVFFAMTYFPRLDVLTPNYDPIEDMKHPYYYQDDNPNGHGLLDHEPTQHFGHSYHNKKKTYIGDDEYLMALDLYSRRLHSSSVQVQQALATLLALYGIAQIKNAKFLWSSTVDPMQFIYKEHYMTELSDCRVKEIRHYLLHKPQGQKQYFPQEINDYHPNDLGHQVYYEEVIKPKINKLQL